MTYRQVAREWTADELIAYASEHGCFERPGDVAIFEQALAEALDAPGLRRRLIVPGSGTVWLGLLPAELARAPALPGSVEIDFPGRYQRKTIVRGSLQVPSAQLGRNGEQALFDRLTILGDVRLGDRLVDVFEVTHCLAGSEPEDGAVSVEFFRRLRPGNYSLSLRAEDGNGLGLLREVRTLEVPEMQREAEPPAGRWNGFAALTREQVGVLTTFPSVEIRPPATTCRWGSSRSSRSPPADRSSASISCSTARPPAATTIRRSPSTSTSAPSPAATW